MVRADKGLGAKPEWSQVTLGIGFGDGFTSSTLVSSRWTPSTMCVS